MAEPVIVLAPDAERNGLATMLASLVRQNLDDRPDKRPSFARLRGRVTIVAEDIGVTLTLSFEGGRLVVHDGFAGIPLGEGIVYRIIILVAGVALGMWWVLRYAARVKADAAKSLVADMKEDNERHFLRREEGSGTSGTPELTSKRKLILGLFGLAFAIMIYGVIPWEDLGIGLPTLWWWFPEMTASFLLFAILIGLVARMGEGDLASTFVDGARDLLGVAMIIGIARGITVVMNNGLITDTVLNWAEVAVGDLGGAVFINLMYVLFLPLSFLIPSSSGLATVAMPIMAPLAAFVGVQADLIVTAFQSASGLMNLFIPTSAVVMGGLAIARVPYGTYLRWVWPLLAMLAGLVIVVVGVGAVMD